MTEPKEGMGCPKGWLDYEPIGRVIPTTRIVAFKTPLKRELHNETNSDPTHDRYVKLGFRYLLLFLIQVQISTNENTQPTLKDLVKD